MTQIKWNSVLVWMFISLFFVLLFFSSMFLFNFDNYNIGPGCYTEYLDGQNPIFFTGSDANGNVFLVVGAPFYSFQEINSTYPFYTTLSPIPNDSKKDIYAIVKFSSDMKLMWSRVIGAPLSSSQNYELRGIKITPDNGLLIVTAGDNFLDQNSVNTSYGNGDYASYVLKFGQDGGLEYLTEFESPIPFDQPVLIEEDGSTIIYSNFVSDDGFQKVNSLANSTGFEMKSVVNLNHRGEVNWVTYLPDIKIYDTEINTGRLGILLADLNHDLLISNITSDHIILELNILNGELYDTQEIQIETFPPLISDNILLASLGTEFLIPMIDKNFQYLYIYNISTKTSSKHSAYLFPADKGNSRFYEKDGIIFLYTSFFNSLSSSLIGEGGMEITWNDQTMDQYFMVFDLSGKSFNSLRILSESFEIIGDYQVFSYWQGSFIVNAVLSSPPFDLNDAFQSKPLGLKDPFVAIIAGGLQKGSFYGNIGVPVMVCAD